MTSGQFYEESFDKEARKLGASSMIYFHSVVPNQMLEKIEKAMAIKKNLL